MSPNEFDQKWSDFIKEFDKNFDTPENRQAIQNVVVQNSQREDDIPLNYEHVFQEQRTNNLVKAALMNFLQIDEN